MAREAERDGIGAVCATPHIRHDHDVRIEELPARVAQLQSELDRLGVRVRIAQGGEVAQGAAEGLSAEQLQAVSLGDGSWILLEPAPGALADELVALVGRLAARGARVVLAHPERHAGPGFEERLHALVAAGALIQWTAAFVLSADAGTASFVRATARAGLVHLLASDAHSSHGGRPLRLREAFERLRETCGAERVEWISLHAPAAILRGEPLTAPW